MNYKKLLLFSMMSLLIFNGCACSFSNNKSEKSNLVLFYDEKDITEKSEFINPGIIRINSQNQLVVSDDEGKNTRYLLLDLEGTPSAMMKCDNFEGNGTMFTLDSKDNFHIYYEEPIMDPNTNLPKEFKRQILIYNNRGEYINKVEIGSVSYQDRQVSQVFDMAVDSAGNYYLAEHKGIAFIDKTGKKIKFIGTYPYCIALDSEDNLIYADDEAGVPGAKPFIEKINAQTGKSIWKTEIPAKTIPKQIKASSKDGYIICMDDKGVKRYTAEGKPAEEYSVDFMSSNILSLNLDLISLNIDNSDNMYILAKDNNSLPNSGNVKYGLFKYQKTDKPKKVEKKTTLVLATAQSNRFLETAINMFQRKNPNISIKIQEYNNASQNPEDFEKYIKSLSTEMMSGAGPDIIDVKNLPYKKYADKNSLVNLDELISKDKDFDINKYNTTLIDLLKYKKQTYTIPLCFGIQSLVANKDEIVKIQASLDDTKWTWQDFITIGEKAVKDINGDGNVDQYAFIKMDDSDLFSYLFASCYNQFVDMENKKANFDSQEFVNLLNMCKQFTDKNLSNPQVVDMAAYPDASDRGQIVFLPQNIYNYMHYSYVKTMFNGKSKILSLPSQVKNGGTYVPKLLISINSNSEHVNEAWEFLKFLLSDEAQSPKELENTGFAINKEALKKRFEEDLKESEDIISQNGGSTVINDRRIDPLTKDDVSAIKKLINDAQNCQNNDLQISSIINRELTPFFTGQKSAVEVSKIIQSKVETYLNE